MDTPTQTQMHKHSHMCGNWHLPSMSIDLSDYLFIYLSPGRLTGVWLFLCFLRPVGEEE